MEKPHPDLSDPEADFLQQDQLERLAAAPALVGREPVKIEELDLLRYQKLVAQAQAYQLLIEKYEGMTTTARNKAVFNGVELGKLLDALGAKYNVDFHVNSISEDGVVAPIPPR